MKAYSIHLPQDPHQSLPQDPHQNLPQKKTCQCTLWQRNQIPCKHAARALTDARIQAQKVVHPSWHLKELRGVFERGKSQLFLPDWKVIHDMATTEGKHSLGKLSDKGIQRVYAQLREVGGDAGRWTSFESFSEWWREQEAKDPKIDPPSKSADFESNFTDAKFKVRAARGQGKKKRRKKSTHGARRGPKKVTRIPSAMDG